MATVTFNKVEKWEYIETPYAGVVVVGDIQLRPHWTGLTDTDRLREICARAVLCVNNHDALVEALGLLAVTAPDGSGKCWCVADPRVFGHRDECVQVRTALAAARE
jgi:hypothetical protein